MEQFWPPIPIIPPMKCLQSWRKDHSRTSSKTLFQDWSTGTSKSCRLWLYHSKLNGATHQNAKVISNKMIHKKPFTDLAIQALTWCDQFSWITSLYHFTWGSLGHLKDVIDGYWLLFLQWQRWGCQMSEEIYDVRRRCSCKWRSSTHESTRWNFWVSDSFCIYLQSTMNIVAAAFLKQSVARFEFPTMSTKVQALPIVSCGTTVLSFA